ncbi:MAG TPA: hypothetical protein P5232_04370 [Candidatus Moranbacteria bacterium]|nr:hypothetical protein [Candidatus Moranbacteria bacterium]
MICEKISSGTYGLSFFLLLFPLIIFFMGILPVYFYKKINYKFENKNEVYESFSKTLKNIFILIILEAVFVFNLSASSFFLGDLNKILNRLEFRGEFIAIGSLTFLLTFFFISIHLARKRMINGSFSWKWLLIYFFVSSAIFFAISFFYTIIFGICVANSGKHGDTVGLIFFILIGILIASLIISPILSLLFGVLPIHLYKKIYYSKYNDKYGKLSVYFKKFIYLLIVLLVLMGFLSYKTCEFKSDRGCLKHKMITK